MSLEDSPSPQPTQSEVGAFQQFEQEKANRNLAAALELNKQHTRKKIESKLELSVPSNEFIANAINQMVLELHASHKLSEDSGLFSKQELDLMVQEKNVEAIKRMVIYLLRNTIRNHPEKDWVTHLVSHKLSLIQHFKDFSIGFIGQKEFSKNSDRETESPPDWRDKYLKKKMLADRRNYAAQKESIMGFTRVMLPLADHPQVIEALANFPSKTTADSSTLLVLHELQHVADDWLGTGIKIDVKKNLLYTAKTALSPQLAWVTYLMGVFSIGGQLYNHLTNTQEFISTEIPFLPVWIAAVVFLIQRFVRPNLMPKIDKAIDRNYEVTNKNEQNARAAEKLAVVTRRVFFPLPDLQRIKVPSNLSKNS